MNGDLAGQVAVVTGGGAGIGRATAVALAARGATVSVVDRDAAAAEQTVRLLGAGARHDVADVARQDEIEGAIGAVARELGRVDVLVNNAGIGGPILPVWEMPADAFRGVLDVNLLGTFFGVRAAVPAMVEQGYGRIVNVASVAGKEGNAYGGAYSASKAAVVALTKSLGKELATAGVLVNAVTPGLVDTDLVRGADPAQMQVLVDKIPMRRRGRPEEIAELIAWLASPRCSFSTGAVFDASGGRTTY